MVAVAGLEERPTEARRAVEEVPQRVVTYTTPKAAMAIMALALDPAQRGRARAQDQDTDRVAVPVAKTSRQPVKLVLRLAAAGVAVSNPADQAAVSAA